MWFKMESYRKQRLDTSESKMDEYQWIVAKKGSLISLTVLMGYLPMVLLHILEYVYTTQLSKFAHALVLAALALSWFLNPIFVILSENELLNQAKTYVKALKNAYHSKSSQSNDTELDTIKA